jgi:hypothetical protein
MREGCVPSPYVRRYPLNPLPHPPLAEDITNYPIPLIHYPFSLVMASTSTQCPEQLIFHLGSTVSKNMLTYAKKSGKIFNQLFRIETESKF